MMYLFICLFVYGYICGVVRFVCVCACVCVHARTCVSAAQFTSNQMSFPVVRFAVKTASLCDQDRVGDASQDQRSLSLPTQADRNVGSREWFKNGASNSP